MGSQTEARKARYADVGVYEHQVTPDRLIAMRQGRLRHLTPLNRGKYKEGGLIVFHSGMTDGGTYLREVSFVDNEAVNQIVSLKAPDDFPAAMGRAHDVTDLVNERNQNSVGR